MFNPASNEIITGHDLAQALNVSQSTLNRRLKRVGTSYNHLKAQYRYQTAKVYLRNTDLSVGSIAGQLGYKEVDNFFKAFKKWSGQTPSQYRTSVGGIKMYAGK